MFNSNQLQQLQQVQQQQVAAHQQQQQHPSPAHHLQQQLHQYQQLQGVQHTAAATVPITPAPSHPAAHNVGFHPYQHPLPARPATPLPTIAAPAPITTTPIAAKSTVANDDNKENRFCELEIDWYDAEKNSLLRPNKLTVQLENIDIGFSPKRNVFVLSNLTKGVSFTLKPQQASQWIKSLTQLACASSPQEGLSSTEELFQCKCPEDSQKSNNKVYKAWTVLQDSNHALR